MKTKALPRLYSLGVEIDTSPKTFGYLRESSDAVDSPAILVERMAEDGYIYLRGFYEQDDVMETRLSNLRQLKGKGFIDPSAPLAEGKSIAGKDAGGAFGNPLDQKDPVVNRLLYGDRMMSFFGSFLGGPAAHFDFTWFRTKGPGYGSAAHCDIVYMGRGTSDLYTAWTPLDDIQLELGGLIILENSHKKRDVLKAYLEKDVDTYCVNKPEAETSASGRKPFDGALSKDVSRLQKKLGGRWLTAEYAMGDLVIFGMATVHAGLDNQTNRIRLSTDSRYQLAYNPIDERWVGESPVGHGAAMKRGRIC